MTGAGSDATRDVEPDASVRPAEHTTTRGPGDDAPTVSVQGSAATLAAPPRVAGFSILSQIGQGATGTVYEALQQSPARRVALKVLRGGTAADAMRLRLWQREVQTLGLLKHPNIAAIHAAGLTEDGRHYFAMEHVPGVPLDEHVWERAAHPGARPRQLIQQRLRLFLQLCGAISYAHQRGVIHRDLKPDNLLVVPGEGEESTPQVKVLDFGLARITDADVAVVSIRTSMGVIQGTLSYMSPEQARGDSREIDLRSDVYSLGVILYELLCGRLPYDVEGAPIHQAVRIICEEPPIPPRRLWQQHHREQEHRPLTRHRPPIKVPRDLETIILRALEKDPERRYQSVGELAADVECFLTSRPIQARPATPLYRLHRWVRRNPTITVALALGLVLLAVIMQVHLGLALLLFVAGPTLFALQQKLATDRIREEKEEAARQRDLARENARRAGAARAEALEAAERASFEAETARQVIDFLVQLFEEADPVQAGGEEIRAADVLDRGARRLREELRDRPLVQVRLLATIGRVYQALGLYQRGVEVLRRALESTRQVFEGDHLEVAAGLQELASALTNSGQAAEAEPLFREALAMRRGLLSEEHTLVAETLCSVAVALQKLGRLQEALSHAQEGHAMQERCLGAGHLHTAQSAHLLATLYRLLGDLPRAEHVARASLAATRAAGGNQVRLAECHTSIGTVLTEAGRHEEAAVEFHRALELRERVYGEVDPRTAESRNNLAASLGHLGRQEEALEQYQLALQVKRDVLPVDDPRISVSLLNLGSLLVQVERPRQAEPIFREALASLRRRLPPGHWQLAHAELALGACLSELGQHEEALELCRRGVPLIREALGDGHWRVRASLQRYLTVCERAGRDAEAAACRQQLEGLPAPPPGHPE